MTAKKVLVVVGLVALICLAAIGSELYFRSRQWLPDRDYEAKVLNVIQTEGIDLALYRVILTDRPRFLNACVVRREAGQDIYEYCNLPGYAGELVKTVLPGKYRAGHTYVLTQTSPLVRGSDGKQYYLLAWFQDVIPTGAWLAYVQMVATVSGWVLLALWIYYDARARGSKAVAGWLLLGLMTGPLGLAVWLVARNDPVKKPVCPGCGARVLSGTMFCVRCGHPLYPACPECGKRVESDWGYCGTCGASLEESGGDKHGLLAHEDGA